MPRPEDVAWKFVIRQGKKWRCPYCEIEYSGSVTRVKSHFLKQRKEGIASCTKVPEHISTLMELLHKNQVHNKEDIAWEFVNRLGDGKWRCHHCSEEFFGDLTGVKGHLLKAPNEGTSICTQVPDPVRKLMGSLLDEEAEEESRKANGQSSTEPQSRDMPLQAEGAEEESREPNNQFSAGPESRDMSTLAEVNEESREVAEEESREANSQFSTGRQSRDMLSSAVPWSTQSWRLEAPFTATLTSDRQQGQSQFHQSLTMPSRVQNSHGLQSELLIANSEDIDPSVASQHTSDSHIIEAATVDLQFPVAATNTIGPSSSQDIEQGFFTQEHDERHCMSRLLEQERILGNGRAAPIGASHPPNVEGATNLQFPQDVPPLTQSSESLEEMAQDARVINITNSPLDGVPSYYVANPPPNSSFTDEDLTYIMEHLDLERLNAQQSLGAPLPSPDRQHPDYIFNELQGSNLHGPISSDTQLSKMATTNTPQHSSQPLPSDSQCGCGTGLVPPITSPPFSGPLFVDSVDPLQISEDIINTIGPWTSEGMLKGTPAATSAFQHDRTTIPHSDEPLPSCNEECGTGTETSSCPLRESMDIYPPTATHVDLQFLEDEANMAGPSSSQASVPPQCQSILHQSINLKAAHQNPTVPSSSLENHSVTRQPQALIDMDPRIPSSSEAPYHTHPPPQIPPGETGLTGPSSLPELDMNKGAPMTSHPSTSNYFEENRALKRKLELLNSKAASMRDEVEFATSLSLKKLRMDVANWLEIVEKLINDYTKASEDCLPSHQQVDILMQEAEDPSRQSNGLFEVRETKVNKLLEGKIVGEAFQRNTTKILDLLVGNQVSRLGIYGMGGVGKTTIMKHIHNRLLEKANYGNVLWITVSQDCNTQKLQDLIWEALGLGTLHVKDVSKRAARLFDCLTKRGKYTIILDDVWVEFDFEEVGIPIRVDGFKLVLTTRSFEVCWQMQCQEKIKIGPLSKTEAESLFMEELGSEVALNLEIEAVAKSIVEECAGLPLGVITMARSMRGVTDVFEWNDSLVKLRESDMRQTNMEKKVLTNLKFSYDRLGDHEVQQCFLSCALYPEDELIDKFELVEFFIDQGLIDKLNTREKQYNRGFTILNKLGNVCLLEDHGREMKMHDLIRDMALHIMSATSIVQARKWSSRIPPEEYWTDALEKVSLMWNYFTEFSLKVSPNCPKLSILLLNHSLYDVVIPDFFFKQLRGLKVLNLSGCYMRELPNSISELVSLRALLLRECGALHCIPYLGKLTSLRKLDASGCDRLEALEGLQMLVNLRYLDLTYTSIKRLPKGTLGGMLNLQYLKVGAAFDKKEVGVVNGEDIQLGVVNGEDITKLGALETLKCYVEDVDDFNKCVRVIKQRYYVLRVDQEKSLFDVEVSDDPRSGYVGWSPFGYQGRRVSHDVEFGNRGREVNIRGWSHDIVSVGGECTGIFILVPEDVQTLMLIDCDGKINLSGMGPLEYLETLFIIRWENLEVLCGGHDEEVIDIHDSPAPTPTPLLFPSLSHMSISNCPKLKYLFGHGSKFFLPNLQGIRISECEEMMGIIAPVTSLPPHSPPAFPRLEDIDVSRCDKMKRVVESEWLPHYPSLKCIHTFGCANLEEIIGGSPPYMPVEKISLKSLEYIYVGWCDKIKRVMEWRPYFPNPESVCVYACENMEEIIGGPPPYMPVEEISLIRLDIHNCKNMRRLFPQEWLIHLRNLGWIFVEHCNGMVEMISGAGQGQGGSIMTPVSITSSPFQPSSIPLPKLEWMCLQKLPQLKSICEVPITCDSLKFLRVGECPELNRIPLQLPLRDTEQLPIISVEGEEKWKSLIWDHPDPQATLQPYLHYYGSTCVLRRKEPPSN